VKALLLIFTWLLLSVVAAALLTPWVYLAGQAISDHFPSVREMVEYKFHRYFNRLVTIFAALGILAIGRRLGYRSWQSLGMRGSHRGPRFGFGFAMSVLFFGLFAFSIELAGFTAPDANLNAALVFKGLFAAIMTGLIVGLIEELFFRGFLYDVLRREINPAVAIVLVSLFYSAVHFVKSPGGYEVTEIRWDSAFQMLPHYFSALQDPERLAIGFLNLFVLGWILAWAYQHSGNLHMSIGLHAGVVFIDKVNGKLTEWTALYTQDWVWLLGFGGDLKTSTLLLVVLILQWWAIGGLSKRLIILGP
jgi:membrane protease YdiL (CAAX protease family)